MSSENLHLHWVVHPQFGAGIIAMADKPTACRWCGVPTVVHVLGKPGHGGCWERAGYPGRPGPSAAVEATGPTARSTAPADPAPADPAPADPTGRRRRPEPARRFQLDPADELVAWTRTLRKITNPASDGDVTDEQAAAALATWHQHVTVKGDALRFVSSPGYTGVAAYEWLTSRHGAMARPEPLRSPEVLAITGSRTVLQVLSFVDRDQDVAVGQAVTELDVTAQYLAAARSAELGDGEPTHVGAIDPGDQAAAFKRPGYVQLAAAPVLEQLPATARLPFAALRSGWWLPTPAARYLQHDHGVTLDVADAWLWPAGHHGRRLSTWCALFADARASLADARAAGDHNAALALRVLKSVYATFLGGMTRSDEHNDRGTLRPDWHDQYVSQAGVNALRALDKVRNASGASPIGGMKDSFWFTSSPTAAPLQPAGLVLADTPGKWHINRWGPVTEDVVGAHRSGRVGVLRKAITAADSARVIAARTDTTAVWSPS